MWPAGAANIQRGCFTTIAKEGGQHHHHGCCCSRGKLSCWLSSSCKGKLIRVGLQVPFSRKWASLLLLFAFRQSIKERQQHVHNWSILARMSKCTRSLGRTRPRRKANFCEFSAKMRSFTIWSSCKWRKSCSILCTFSIRIILAHWGKRKGTRTKRSSSINWVNTRTNT